MDSPSDTLLLGTRKGLARFERSRGRWRLAALDLPGIPVAYAARDPRDGTVWAALDHGHWGQKLVRSRGGGEFTEVPAPAYPPDAKRPNGEPATLRYLWVLAFGGEDQPGRLWAGTEPGGLFRSDDGGESFELVRSLWEHETHTEKGWFGGGRDTPGIHSILVDPRDARRIHVAISCAGVFESTDDGASWTVRNRGLRAEFLPDPSSEVGQDPHCIVRSPADPDVLWQQNHCGIWRSTDGGASWTEISDPQGPARFGFPIVAAEDDRETAWVVPAKSDGERMAQDGALVVCRTSDGGRSWETLREGLPQEGAYDLVYRHGLDRSGARLAFGSTTGNAYLSEDRGESWQALGQNLPPIYSVRYA